MELDPHFCPEEIMSRGVELSKLFVNSGATDIVLVTLSSTAVERAIAQCTSRWAMARGHRLDTSIVLAAVCGLSGLFRAVSAVEPITLSSPSHSVPVPNKAISPPWTLSNMKSKTGSVIVQELCESRGGRPGLSVLTSLLVSVDVKIYWTMLRHWSQLVPNMSTDIWGH